MSSFTYTISIIVFSAVVKVHSLQCYDCTNCAKVTDNQLVTCGESSTTVTPTTTPSGQSTVTVSSSTTTQQPGQTTTLQPGQTTTQAQTTTPATVEVQTESTGTQTTVTQTTSGSSSSSSPAEGNASSSFRGRNVADAVVTVNQGKAADFVCVTLKYKENSTDVFDRHCVLVSDGVDYCEAETSSASNATCTHCNTDKCNGAAAIQISLVLMFAVIISKFM